MNGAGEIPSLSKVFRGPEKHRHVAIMTTTMHLPFDLRAVRECVRLHQVEGIHVCPQSDGAPVVRLVTLDGTDHTGASQSAVHRIAKSRKLVRDKVRRPDFLEGGFRMRVQGMTPLRHFRMKIGDSVDDGHLLTPS